MGLLALLSSPHRLHVLCYHRIAEKEEAITQCAYDKGVFTCTAETFKSQINWLKINTNILSLDKLIYMLNGGNVGKGPYSMITFDDAYRDIYKVAYPILKRLQLPAVIFVPTKLIEDGRLGWWDMLAYILQNCRRSNICYEGNIFTLPTDFERALRFFLDKMKLEPFQKNQKLITKLAHICRVQLPDPQEQATQMMTWEQLKEITTECFEVGSHTHTHRVLGTISPEEQRQELSTSKILLERKLNKPVVSLAYPVGGYRHFTKTTQMIAKDCGYKVAFSFNTGYNKTVNNLNLYDICRFEPAKNNVLLAGQCALPSLFL